MPVATFQTAVSDTRQYLNEDRSIIPTGYPTIDRYLRGGLSPGQVTFLFARKEVGKSVLATNMAVNAVEAGFGAGIVSLEMTEPEVVLRVLSIHLGVGTDEVEALLKDKSFSSQMASAMKALKGLAIAAFSGPSWGDLEAWVAEVRKTQPVDLVVLDHLKLMSRKGYYSRGEVERVQQLAEDSKRFAKNADVSLVVIHQAGRSVEGELSKKNHGDIPLTAEDMMHGGEQDADYILGLFRPELNPDLSKGERALAEGRMFIQVLKNRNGKRLEEGVETIWKLPSLRVTEK